MQQRIFLRKPSLSFCEGEMPVETPNGEPSVVSRVTCLHQEAGYWMHRNAANPNLTPQERQESQLITWSFYQKQISELQAETEQRTASLSPGIRPTQERYLDGSYVQTPMAFMPQLAATSSPHPTGQATDSSQLSVAGSMDWIRQPGQVWNFDADTLTSLNPHGIGSSSSMSSPLRSARSSPDTSQQVAPYSLQDARRQNRLSQQGNEQNLTSATGVHRKARSTGELRAICRVDDCSSSFSRARDEKRHFDAIHRQYVHECPLCERAFTRRDSLKRHLEKSCIWFHGKKK